MVEISDRELARLRRIEALAAKAVRASTPFVSAWEFDHHGAPDYVDPEGVYAELKALLEPVDDTPP